MMNIVTYEEIVEGKVTDLYFERTREILKKKGIKKRVRAEVMAKSLPDDWDWAVFAGLDEAFSLFKEVKGRGMDLNIRAIPEGSIFRPWNAVLEIEGDYADFCVYETAILGFLCQASGIATMAARCRLAAAEKMLLSFGGRRMHPAISPMIDRSAWIGGFDGVSIVTSAQRLGVKPSGTMPHGLVLVMGDTVEATKAFAEYFGSQAKVISLIDTIGDEKFEAVRVADALGKELFGVRLDTPASRRGDFERIIREVKWELSLRGHENVGIYVSVGLVEYEIAKLIPFVDGFGMGTYLSSGRAIDFSMDIVEIEGKPMAKRGKYAGAKDLFHCPECYLTKSVPMGKRPFGYCECGGKWAKMTEEAIPGKFDVTVESARKRVIRAITTLRALT
ncbi:nicotinate phosphoribosyltransferase [bacterium]|nr:MAG: nicotinate phosphoribosyltransferase [bacterium]